MAYNKRPNLGQATMANSEPVVLASDQASIPVAATLTAETTKVIGTVNVASSQTIAVTNATAANLKAEVVGTGTFVVQAAQATASSLNMTEASAASALTSLQLIDDAIVSQATALGSTKNALVAGSVTTAAPTYTTGNINPLSLATTGALRVDLSSTAANATAVKVNIASGGIASGGIASGAIASGAIAAGAIAAGNTSIATTEDTARAAGEHLVKVGLSRLDTLAANANVSNDGDYTNFICDNNGALWVDPQGNVANDAVDVGNPIKIGGRASSTPIAAVAANDRVDAFFDVQGRQVVTMKSLTGTASNVASSATNVTILAANTLRLGATIWNDSTAVLYLKLGATASATSCTVKLIADAYYEVPFGYYGIIDGIWSAANGAARVTELT